MRPLLGKTRRVFISPDGALNLIPFAALVDEHDHYLVRHYTFSYLTSGRDLLRLQTPRTGKQSAMIVADPDFGESASEGQAANRGLKLNYQPAPQASSADRFSLADAYFPPLPGTAGEAEAIKALLPEATVLTRARATEASLKQVSSPQLLHIATHGFFLSDLAAGEAGGRQLKQIGIASETPAISASRIRCCVQAWHWRARIGERAVPTEKTTAC